MPKAVILTALPIEYLAILAHLTNVEEIVHPQGTVYESGTFRGDAQEWDVAVVEVGIGNQRAAAETERALSFFAPVVAMFVGVTGGLNDVLLGDVVAATKVYAYEYGKANVEFFPRPEIGLGSYPLVQRARQVARDNEWQRRIPTSSDGVPPKALVKPIAAGAQVVASNRSPTFEFLRTHYSDAAAVEMEGHGFLEAVHPWGGVLALVVRGISDLIEGKSQSDSEGWQLTAAQNAAAFSFEVFARFHPGQMHVDSQLPLRPSPKKLSNKASNTLRGQTSAFRTRGVPPARVRTFTGRRAELEQIDAHLRDGAGAEPTILVIHGLSGVGKTQLCREYLESQAEDYGLARWISADDQTAITSDLAQMAIDLELTGADHRELLASSMAVLRWLEYNANWLLIFDNASPDTIQSWLPSRGFGDILITSTNPTWSAITSDAIGLEGLALEDAVQFLMRRTSSTDSAAAARIASSFDCLPLALEQAAAYIPKSRINLCDYEHLLEKHRPELLDEQSPFTDYPESVYSALSLNIDRAYENSSHVTMLLAFVAYLNPTAIPRELVKSAMRDCYQQIGETFNDFIFNRLISEISEVSLIVADTTAISTHPLVQAFMRDHMGAEHRAEWPGFVLNSLAFAFPEDVDDSSTWPTCDSLINHVTSAMELSDFQSWDDEWIRSLYTNAGSYLHARGRDNIAIKLLEKALANTVAEFGEHHPLVALASNNLLNALDEIGHSDEALKLGERAIGILTNSEERRKKFAVELGKVYSNMGRIYMHRSRDFKTARFYIDRALEIHLEILGNKHHTTAIDLNNLGTVDREEAIWASKIGVLEEANIKWRSAYNHFYQAVAIHRTALSSSDYRLAIALFNLGQSTNNLTRFDEAEGYLREAVRINEILKDGSKGSDQIDALVGLGHTLQALENPREAITYFDRATEIAGRLFGPESPQVQSIFLKRGSAAFDLGRHLLCQIEPRDVDVWD